MAAVNAAAATSTIFRASAAGKVPAAAASSSSPVSGVTGLPRVANGGRVKCCEKDKKRSTGVAGKRTGAALLAAASVMSVSNPVLALVDERMSTEGTGLSLGLSNNLLGWILFGVFGLIWSVFFVYTSTLEEDEDSGLSL
ncbi:photosystem II reaction center W protein, chloroplastic-like isoform X1 [Typha latifolia]|uniref:photosystem II reaction center W protein, chloroplastic-like isoform X1 n=1 Tax=Typha latifolia TaxID=4733 RepID=UPI003C2BBD79